MRVLGNIIWFIFGGLILSIVWLLLGIVLCITIIGIPFGLQCFKVSKLVIAPFGKKVTMHFGSHPIANFLWVILFGWWLALVQFLMGVITCITIIGIPAGLQSFKMAKLAFAPFGATIDKIV